LIKSVTIYLIIIVIIIIIISIIIMIIIFYYRFFEGTSLEPVVNSTYRTSLIMCSVPE
jgi:hypothetical protein